MLHANQMFNSPLNIAGDGWKSPHNNNPAALEYISCCLCSSPRALSDKNVRDFDAILPFVQYTQAC